MIWYDVTEVKNWRGHHTGIQRVITKLGEQLIRKGEGFQTCYFDSSTNTFRKCTYDFGAEVIYANSADQPLKYFGQKLGRLSERLKAQTPPRIKFYLKRLRKILALHNVVDEAVNFSEGDVLFIPGAFWIYSFDHVEALKQIKNIKVVGVMYDLVPLVTPQFTAEVTIVGFEQNFNRALNIFDHWFSISNNTKQDLLRLARDRGIPVDTNAVSVIKLGVDMPLDSQTDHPPDGPNLKNESFALFVSTLEARKNQFLVYQAIKRLQENDQSIMPVVLVGKHGWLSDDFVYLLRHDPDIKGSIVWLERVDDAGLRWLYKNCAFTIYPSYYEGWGLPVAEALAYGKPCIASNASSLPEVGGKLLEYFSPYSSDELAELLIKYNQPEHLTKATKRALQFEAPTWAACAETVMQVLGSPHS